MKFFFPACVVGGLALSVLAVVLAIRQRPLSEKKVSAPPAPVVLVQKLYADEESRKNITKLMEELQNERTVIRKKEAELNSRTEKLQQTEQVLQRLKSDLQQLQGKLEETTVRTVQSEQANMKRLAEVYGKMEPDSVATLLSKMEVDRAASIVRLLNERQAGAVLAAAVASGTNGTRNAAAWSDNIRRMAQDKPTRK